MPNKPLGDWTLGEAKAECASHSECTEPILCPFWDADRICKLGKRYPYKFKLTEGETE